MTTARAIVDRRIFGRNHRPSSATTAGKAASSEARNVDPAPEHDENHGLPVEELLQRGTVHPPYGEQVIDDLTSEEAEAFLDALLS